MALVIFLSSDVMYGQSGSLLNEVQLSSHPLLSYDIHLCLSSYKQLHAKLTCGLGSLSLIFCTMYVQPGTLTNGR